MEKNEKDRAGEKEVRLHLQVIPVQQSELGYVRYSRDESEFKLMMLRITN